ncbi:MAG: hydroxyisourate hydrolase [Rhodospirillaceae bacterium]|nr:hydroxyisourate hydrolase [Rhodospirillaceae bacterium]|tara:strand:- start:10334 stop:10687 length:354 start_codon:yes stop_codon:yes gene_type:complete
MASLTTHILDTANGVPAAGVTIEIVKVSGEKRVTLRTIKTNDDGRTDAPVLAGDQCIPGVYELVFHIGDYFRNRKTDPDPSIFLDTIPVQFIISSEDEHYHVPLLASPWSYSTYRGS